MPVASDGYRAVLVSQQPTPGLISSLSGTGGLPPFISFSTSYPETLLACPLTGHGSDRMCKAVSNGEEHSQNRQEGAPQNRREGQTIPLRKVPKKKPETCQNACTLVLPDLPESNWGFRISVAIGQEKSPC